MGKRVRKWGGALSADEGNAIPSETKSILKRGSQVTSNNEWRKTRVL